MWLFITISKYRSDRRRVEIVIYNIVWYNTISWYFYLLELEITKSKSRGCICIFNLVPVVQHFDLFLLFNEIVRSRIWMDIQKPSIYCFTFYIKLLKWISHIYTTSVFYSFLHIIIIMRLWTSILGPIVMSLPTIISCVFTYILVPMVKYLKKIWMPKRWLKCRPNESQGRLGIMRTFMSAKMTFCQVHLLSYGKMVVLYTCYVAIA